MAYDPLPFVDATGVAVWSAKVAGDSNNRVQITADGQMSWGPGNAAVDTFQSRSAVGQVAFGEVDGTAAHSILIYHNRTASGVNYERGIIGWVSNRLLIRTEQAGAGVARVIRFGTDGSGRWDISTAGHILAASDNLYDFGASAATRPRSIYWGTQALGPDGLAGSPTYSFASDPDMGLFAFGNSLIYSSGNDSRVAMVTTGVRLEDAGSFSWSGDANPINAADLFLYRDAANTLAQRNGTSPQISRIYETFTNASNYGRLDTGFNIVGDSAWDYITRAAGTGTVRLLRIGTQGSAALRFRTNSTDRWQMLIGGSFVTITDNAIDVGASGATRPRTIYVGTSVIIGAHETTTQSGPLEVFGATNAIGVFRDTNDDCEVFIGPAGTTGFVGTATSHDFRVRTANANRWLFNNSLSGGLTASANLRFAHGTSALATTATEGFLFIQSCAGPPTGTPASIPTGQVAVVYDSTNDEIYFYNGSWRSVAVA